MKSKKAVKISGTKLATDLNLSQNRKHKIMCKYLIIHDSISAVFLQKYNQLQEIVLTPTHKIFILTFILLQKDHCAILAKP